MENNSLKALLKQINKAPQKLVRWFSPVRLDNNHSDQIDCDNYAKNTVRQKEESVLGKQVHKKGDLKKKENKNIDFTRKDVLGNNINLYYLVMF